MSRFNRLVFLTALLLAGALFCGAIDQVLGQGQTIIYNDYYCFTYACANFPDDNWGGTCGNCDYSVDPATGIKWCGEHDGDICVIPDNTILNGCTGKCAISGADCTKEWAKCQS
jgi:hypothetical protein